MCSRSRHCALPAPRVVSEGPTALWYLDGKTAKSTLRERPVALDQPICDADPHGREGVVAAPAPA